MEEMVHPMEENTKGQSDNVDGMMWKVEDTKKGMTRMEHMLT